MLQILYADCSGLLINFGAIYALSPKITKKITKLRKFSRLSMSVFLESWLIVALVMISSKYVYHCDRFLRFMNFVILAEIAHSKERYMYLNLKPHYAVLFEIKRSKLKLLKCTFNAKYFTCSLSWSIYSQFILRMCAASLKFKKITRTPILKFKVVDFRVNQKGVWDFLLVINSNLSRSLRYGDLLAQNRHFSYPPFI